MTELERAQAWAAGERAEGDGAGRQAGRGWTRSPGGVWVPPGAPGPSPPADPPTARAETKDGVFVTLFRAGHLRVVPEGRGRVVMALAVACLWGPVLLYWLLWRVNLEFWIIARLRTGGPNVLLAVGLVLLSVALHESLHGAGLVVLGRVPWRAVRFGVKAWPQGTPYTTCTRPVRAGVYRQTTLLPLLLLGVLPGIIGFAWHLNGLALLAILNVTFCTRDLVCFWNSLRYDSATVLTMRP